MAAQNGVTRSQDAPSVHRVNLPHREPDQEPPKPALAALARVATDGRVIAGVLATAAAGGFGLALYLGGLAKKEDVHQVQERTAAAIGSVETEVRALASRVDRAEVVLLRIDGSLDRLLQRLEANVVPPPAPPASRNH